MKPWDWLTVADWEQCCRDYSEWGVFYTRDWPLPIDGYIVRMHSIEELGTERYGYPEFSGPTGPLTPSLNPVECSFRLDSLPDTDTPGTIEPVRLEVQELEPREC